MAAKKTAAKVDAVAAPEASDTQFVRVFYRELTPTGRTGAIASQDFGSAKDAEAFRAEIDGWVE